MSKKFTCSSGKNYASGGAVKPSDQVLPVGTVKNDFASDMARSMGSKGFASGGRVEASKPVKEKLAANTAKPDFGKTNMKTMTGTERKEKC